MYIPISGLVWYGPVWSGRVLVGLAWPGIVWYGYTDVDVCTRDHMCVLYVCMYLHGLSMYLYVSVSECLHM